MDLPSSAFHSSPLLHLAGFESTWGFGQNKEKTCEISKQLALREMKKEMGPDSEQSQICFHRGLSTEPELVGFTQPAKSSVTVRSPEWSGTKLLAGLA